MKAQDLKNSIIQLAVQGKLVPQDHADEPASILLTKIRAEKEKLIKTGKLKKEKNPSEIVIDSDGIPYEKFADGKPVDISDEIPFAIPSTWQWVRLGEIANIIRGSGIKRDEVCTTGIQCVRYGELYTTYGVSFTSTVSYVPLHIAERCKPIKYGDVLCTLTGEYKSEIGKSTAYLGNTEVVIGGDLATITNHHCDPMYLAYFMYSPFAITQKANCSNGDIIVHISGEKLKNILLPVPPLAEQQRIVAKIEELLPHIEKYGKAEEELDELQRRFPNELKKSILQSAIQGNLVPQDPADEPAEVLLERIRTEKACLIKSGKIKPAKNETTIFRASDRLHYERCDTETRCIEDELPFQIPDSWQWVRLSDSCEIYTGNSINEQEKAQKYSNVLAGRNYIATKDVGFDGEIHYTNGVKIPQNEMKFRIAPKQSTLMCIEGGSSGRKIGFLKEDVCFGNKLCAFVPQKILYPQFLFYYLQTPQFLTKFKANETGIIGGTSISKIKILFLPLPPIDEQIRIVAQIEKFLCYKEEFSG